MCVCEWPQDLPMDKKHETNVIFTTAKKPNCPRFTALLWDPTLKDQQQVTRQLMDDLLINFVNLLNCKILTSTVKSDATHRQIESISGLLITVVQWIVVTCWS